MSDNGGWTGEAEEAWGCILWPVKIVAAFLALAAFYAFVVLPSILMAEAFYYQLGWLNVDQGVKTFLSILTIFLYLGIIAWMIVMARRRIPDWWIDYFCGVFGGTLLIISGQQMWDIAQSMTVWTAVDTLTSQTAFNELGIWVTGLELVCLFFYHKVVAKNRTR